MENFIALTCLYLFYQWLVMDEKTKVDRIIQKLKNYRFVAYTVVIVAVIIVIGSLTGAIDNIIQFSQTYILKTQPEVILIALKYDINSTNY